jgi:ribonuclease HI
MSTDDKSFKAFRSKVKLHVGSDGGLHNNSATHGWVLSTGKEILYQGSGPVDGPPDSHTSTRSKLGGCASALLLLTSLSKLWGTKHRCTFKWYTDSRSAISRVTKFSRRRSSRRRMPPDVDLLTIISDCLKELRRPFKAKWIKAHQDRVVS